MNITIKLLQEYWHQLFLKRLKNQLNKNDNISGWIFQKVTTNDEHGVVTDEDLPPPPTPTPPPLNWPIS